MEFNESYPLAMTNSSLLNVAIVREFYLFQNGGYFPSVMLSIVYQRVNPNRPKDGMGFTL